MNDLNVLYITKMRKSQACGVTVAVTQLLNSLCNVCDITWLDISGNQFDVDNRIKKRTRDDFLDDKVDIAVFADPFNSLEFCSIASILRKNKIPYIISPHGCFHRNALKNKAVKKYIAIHTVFRQFLKKAYGVQFLCENEKNNSLQFNTSLIIPNGIESSQLFRERKCVKNFTFISRKDVTNKGIDLLLEAADQLRDELEKKEISIRIFGSHESDKDDKYIADMIANYKLTSIVQNFGPVFGDEKQGTLDDTDVFVLVSRHEGFPMSVLEALSFGIPTLVSVETNMGNLINSNHAGWVCNAEVGSVVKAMRDAIAEENLSQLSRNARELANNYTWSSVANDTVSTYKKIIDL